uniref:INCENP_ARK-bind domain-containing protein n=1 Tax=Loa loa TaxID=7209 RepID=A0A1I7VAT4_LOALO
MNDCDELDNLRNAVKGYEMQSATVFGDIPVGVYVGEYDNDKNKLKKRDKPPGHVQWNLQANTELDEPKDTSNSVEISKQLKTIRNDKQDRQSNVIRSISANDNQSKFYYNDHVERISRSLLSLNKEKVDKQFPKVVPVQPVKPMVTTISVAMKTPTITTTTLPIKRRESFSDTRPQLFHVLE